MSAETPTSYARKLCSYITSDSDVKKHVKRMWGVEFSLNDIAKIRRDAPFSNARKVLVREPLKLSPPVTTNPKGVDKLAVALFKYHAKHAETEEARNYWKGKIS